MSWTDRREAWRSATEVLGLKRVKRSLHKWRGTIDGFKVRLGWTRGSYGASTESWLSVRREAPAPFFRIRPEVAPAGSLASEVLHGQSWKVSTRRNKPLIRAYLTPARQALLDTYFLTRPHAHVVIVARKAVHFRISRLLADSDEIVKFAQDAVRLSQHV